MDIPGEARTLLKALVEADKHGRGSAAVVSDATFLATPPELSGMSAESFDRSIRVLVENGLAFGTVNPVDGRVYRYGGLTSAGASFFDDEKSRAKEKRREKWSDRRFTIAMSIVTFALSIIASVIVSLIL